jgi:hypothetical protein
MPSYDGHVTVVPYFTVADGKMEEFKKFFPDFYAGTKAGTKECMYYGFATCGNKAFCREGYKSAEGVLAHLGDVKATLDKAVAFVGEGGLNLAVMGPPKELEKLKEPLGPLGTKFYETDRGCMWFGGIEEGPDTHVTIVPYFTVPDGKMAAFKKGFGQFYKGTRTGTKETIYYGFATEGNTVFCREGYKNAEGCLAHLGDVKEALDKALEIVGEGGLDLAVMGPAAELEKLKAAMGPLGTKFWETDAGCAWYPAGTSEPKLQAAPAGATDMKVTMKKGSGFYANAACSFLRGVEAKPAEDGKEAVEAKPSVEHLRLSGLGDAVNVAVAAAEKAVSEKLATITKIQTAYPSMEGSGRPCGQIVIDLKRV